MRPAAMTTCAYTQSRSIAGNALCYLEFWRLEFAALPVPVYQAPLLAPFVAYATAPDRRDGREPGRCASGPSP